MTLLAGAAARDITPTRPLPLFGYPHVERIATGTHDPLLASALVLRGAEGGAVLVSLDLLFLDPPTARSLRAAAAEAADVPEESVLLSCTHTHSGPVTLMMEAWRGDVAMPEPDAAYLASLRPAVAQTVAAAAARAVPARIAWTAADARGVGGNRHAPDGCTDPEAGLLSVRSAEGRPLAAAVVYGMHPTVLHEDSTLYSSDFVHYVRASLRERFGPGFVPLWHTGPAGDQSPRRHVTAQTFAEAERLGRRLGASLADSLAALPKKAFDAAPLLAGTKEAVDLPRRSLPDPAEAARREEAARSEYESLRAAGAERARVRTAECALFGAEGTVRLARAEAEGRLAERLARYRPLEVQTVRLGEACLAGFPGEAFAAYALAMKKTAAMKTFPVSLVNGELQGYVVTPEAAAAGGYEATNSVFAPAAGPVLVETVARQVDRLARLRHDATTVSA
jgi:hypothetical protein